jgi:hypothetical protein
MAGLTDRTNAAIAGNGVLELQGVPVEELFFDEMITIPAGKKLWIKGNSRTVEIRLPNNEILFTNFGQLDLRKLVTKPQIAGNRFMIRSALSGFPVGVSTKDCILTGLCWGFDAAFTATLA